MAILAAILLALVLVLATITIHYEALRKTSDVIPSLTAPHRTRILVAIVVIFLAHLAEIALYAGAFALMNNLGFGALSGNLEGNALDYFYLSMTSYTTLGVGDLYPTGAMRIVSAVESLNGFVLVGWSASFTYLEMQRFWGRERGKTRRVRR